MDRPSRETSPHTSGLVAWMMWGPQNTKYTPPKVLKVLGQAIATMTGPWEASSRLVSEEVHMYVDAAYMVGVWADDAGARLWEAPPTVWNQQAAELLAVEKAVQMAAYRGMKELNLGVDNLAAVWAAMNKRSKIHLRDRAMVVRKI